MMYALLILINFLIVQIDIVSPSCQKREAFKNKLCCIQATQVIALASAATKTAVDVYAAAHVSLTAAMEVGVSASIVASATAQVALVNSVAIALDVGNCCEISVTASADAKADAYAAANASAEALASATASASASAASIGIAEAASSILTLAQSIIQSSRCNFSLEVINAVEIAGSYYENATGIAMISSNISANAQTVALAAAYAASNASASASALANVSIDNCCVDSRTVIFVNDTSSASLAVTEHINDLQNMTSYGFELIESYALDNKSISTLLDLSNSLCLSECANVNIACCTNLKCCNKTDQTACLASKVISKVYIRTTAVVKAISKTIVWVKSLVSAVTDALVTASTAAKAAAIAKVSVKVNMVNCCKIKVNVDTKVKAYAKSISTALAKAKAAASVYAVGSAKALAFVNATAQAASVGEAVSQLFSDECCGSDCCQKNFYYLHPSLTCCQVSSDVKRHFAFSYESSLMSEVSKFTDRLDKGIKSADQVNDTSINKVMDLSKSSQTIILNCCCCNQTRSG